MNSFLRMHKIFAGLPNPPTTHKPVCAHKSQMATSRQQFLGPTPKKLGIPYNAVDKYGHKYNSFDSANILTELAGSGGREGEGGGGSNTTQEPLQLSSPTQPKPSQPSKQIHQDKLRNATVLIVGPCSGAQLFKRK